MLHYIICNKTLGIVGAGRIGEAFALKSKGFKMNVLYVDGRVNTTIEKELGARKVEFVKLLRKSDYISLHVPLTKEAHHLIGEKELRLMKKDAILINTSRGPVVDAKALVRALKEKWIFGAGLDVYEHEPEITKDLKKLDNIVLQPHSASATFESRMLELKLDTAKTGAPINPYIYGQFIEHLGRCIYGGIWAEMLEDRKFYFPVTANYAPYRSLQDSAFPVVGASPWQILGDPGKVAMVKEDVFVGDHTPRLGAGSGIRQRDLGLVGGKPYVGYLWAKPLGRPAEIEVTLVWGGGADERNSKRLAFRGGKYTKHHFSFTPLAGGETNGILEIRVLSGEVLLGQMGENVVRSGYLSTGYWHNPELTAAKFKPRSRGSKQTALLHRGPWIHAPRRLLSAQRAQGRPD